MIEFDRPAKFSVVREFAGDTINLRMAVHAASGRLHFAQPVVFEERESGGYVDPFLRLSPEDATRLMDELWGAGVRPTSVGTAGQLEAVKYHLEDMRKLVFK